MEKIKLKFVEVFYGYRCNLSCQGCTSASDVVKTTDSDPSLESIFLSVEQLSNYVYPESVDLMGGELFLYWDKVVQIVPVIRKYFPTSRISLVTNGLLLPKYKEQLLELCETYHPCTIDITNHFTLFSKDVRTKKYQKKLDAFLSTLTKTEEIKWKNPIEHLRTHKTPDIENPKELLVQKQIYKDDKIYVKLYNQQAFVSSYYKTEDGKIKPHATNDPDGSYANGCAMPYRYFLRDSKLYKCSWFSVLPEILKSYGQEDDPDWQKYLAYQPIDLNNPTVESLEEFDRTKRAGISLCDMCSNNPNNAVVHTRDQVLPANN
jgi:organic radical activating enzyme